MTRIVGKQDRSEIILDPAEAWRRGRVLDRMLPSPLPRTRPKVLRAKHAELNRLDDARALQLARRLNGA